MGKCEQCITRKLSSFKALTPKELKDISKCKETLEFEKGDYIFEEGKKINGLYCVRQGVCKFSKMNADGKDTIVKLSTSGDLIGLPSVFGDQKSDLNAIAVEDMQVCFIPKDEILNFFYQNRDFSKEIVKDLARQLKEANDYATSHNHKTVKQRLATALLMIQEIRGVDEEGFMILQLPREDIANIVGTATESCIRLLSEMKREQLLTLKNKRIKIIDTQKLKELTI